MNRFSLLVAFMLFLVCASYNPGEATAASYLVTVKQVKVQPKKNRFMRWDSGWGKTPLPDLFVQVDISGKRLQTRVVNDTISAVFSVSKLYKGLTGKEKVYIKVLDSDGVSNHDKVGATALSFSQFLKKKTLKFGKVLQFTYSVQKVDSFEEAQARAAKAKAAADKARKAALAAKAKAAKASAEKKLAEEKAKAAAKKASKAKKESQKAATAAKAKAKAAKAAANKASKAKKSEKNNTENDN